MLCSTFAKKKDVACKILTYTGHDGTCATFGDLRAGENHIGPISSPGIKQQRQDKTRGKGQELRTGRRLDSFLRGWVRQSLRPEAIRLREAALSSASEAGSGTRNGGSTPDSYL
jgi:hypothetical protein